MVFVLRDCFKKIIICFIAFRQGLFVNHRKRVQGLLRGGIKHPVDLG